MCAVTIEATRTTVQLHLEHAILFAQKLNHIALLSIKPPEQRPQGASEVEPRAESTSKPVDAIFGQNGAVHGQWPRRNDIEGAGWFSLDVIS